MLNRRRRRSQIERASEHPCRRGSGWFACLALFVLLVGCSDGSPAPDVVLVVLDTLRADAVGATLRGHPVTPSLDALIEGGARFESAYANAPWTLPSHASLLTGLLPSTHGAVHERFLLAPGLRTLAERLSEMGYRSLGISSNPWIGRTRGFDQGFDRFREVFLELDGAPDKGAARAIEQAVAWTAESRAEQKPFFLFVNLLEAHLPYAPPDSILAELGIDRSDLLRGRFDILEAEEIIAGERDASEEEIELARTLYLLEVAYQDRQLARLFEALQRTGRPRGTLIVVTADHGELFAEHGLMGHEFSLADPVLHVPLVIHMPGRIPPAQSSAVPVSLVDVYPTIFDLLGRPANGPSFHGRSLVPALTLEGADAPQPGVAPRPLIAEYSRPHTLLHDYWAPRHPRLDLSPFDVALRAIRRGRMKLVVSGRGREQLFDVMADPGEELDLHAEAASEVEDLRRALESWTGPFPADEPAEEKAPIDR